MPEPISSYVPQFVEGDGGTSPAEERLGSGAFLVWALITVAAVAFAALALAAPLAAASGHVGFASVLYDGFRVVCHQIPGRSYELAGYPLAVCARCAGLYFGFAAGALAYPLLRRGFARPQNMPPRSWLVAAALPTVIDFALGFSGLWENTHLSRALTASLLGAVAALYVVPGVLDARRLLWSRRPRTRVVPSFTTSSE